MEKVKIALYREFEEMFLSENIKNFDDAFNVFAQIVEKYKLHQIKDALLIPTDEYTGNELKKARTILISHFETYFKILYDIIGIDIDGELKVCLVEFFRTNYFLKEHGNSFKFFEKIDGTKVPAYPPSYFNNKMPFGRELKNTYDMRNAILHKGKLFGDIEPTDDTINFDVRASIISIIFITSKYCQQISSILERDSVKVYLPYFLKVKNDFLRWNSRFVHITGKEEFEEVALFARETDSNNIDRVEKKELREGRIEELRKRLIIERQYQMVITGDAGMGKSTTLQYLAYKDSIAGIKIPIYVEMKLITPEAPLIKIFCEKTNLEESVIKDLLIKGKINLFFDGLNEILPMIKQRIFIEIQNIINLYPKNFVLIATRKQGYRNDFGNVPVFELQNMRDNQIYEFLEKNSVKAVSTQIRIAMNSNDNWLKLLGNPLVLFMLIQVVSSEGVLPNDENKIILKFIMNIYQREREKEINFNIDDFHLFITHLAYESIELKGNTNSGMTLFEIEKILQKKDKNLTYLNAIKIINKAVALNIMAQDEKLYSFVHQSYQETLAGDYFNSLFI